MPETSASARCSPGGCCPPGLRTHQLQWRRASLSRGLAPRRRLVTIRRRRAARPAGCADAGWRGNYPPPVARALELEVAGRAIRIDAGEVGRLANGAVLATDGETVVYATVCCDDEPAVSDFAPFQVHYQEKFSAAGKTTKAYGKRERQADHEVLTSRLVDRALRPLLHPRWRNDTQVLIWVLSYDGAHPPEPLAVLAAGCALAVSDIPMMGTLAAVGVGWREGGGAILGPTVEQQEVSKLDMVVGGTAEGVCMIEARCDFLEEELVNEAVRAAAGAVAGMSGKIEGWASMVGKEKRGDLLEVPEGLRVEMEASVGGNLREALGIPQKEARNVAFEAARKSTLEEFSGGEGEGRYSTEAVRLEFQALASSLLRQKVLSEGVRVDGRGLRDVRPIVSRCHILPRTHGSALFTRGGTQALCVTTLGSAQSAQRISTMQEEDLQHFYLQYFFPPSCVGETGRVLGPGRRELGHGQLASNGLLPIVPDQDVFPYTVRVESNITESDGSSSMATVCSACLSMMDAGVPILRPVAGIAMGLMVHDGGEATVLSDIIGFEDGFGHMDFKVAGDREAITAVQMDIKVPTVSVDTVAAVLEQAGQGRGDILAAMAKCEPAPRQALSKHAPVIARTKIDPKLTARLIGSGGRTINQVKDVSGVDSVDVDSSGMVEICGPDQDAVTRAEDMVRVLVGTPQIGKIYRGCRVTDTFPFGAFVEIVPGKDGLVPIGELDVKRVVETTDVVAVGDLVDVEVLSVNDIGKLALSRKRVLLKDSGQWVEGASENEPRSGPLTPKARRKSGRRSREERERTDKAEVVELPVPVMAAPPTGRGKSSGADGVGKDDGKGQ